MVDKKRAGIILVLVVTLSLGAALFDYQPLWEKVGGTRLWKLGLDIAGGSYLTYEVDLSKVAPGDRDSVVAGLRDVIEKRINLFGAREPKVYIESTGEKKRLVIELAGEKDTSKAIQEIGATPFLDFREVLQEGTSTPQFIPTALNGRYVQDAQVMFSSVGQPEISLSFNDEGGKIFEELTAKNIGKPIAIFLDNQLIETPMVQEKISGGKAQITGKFTLQSARELVSRFNAGALPAPIVLVNQHTIDADFGKEGLNRAMFAGIAGTLAIIVFMMISYGRLGIFASCALLMYIALTLGMFKLIGVTMTLAGIAGFILSVGMAVDANILVFERTKEELQRGLSQRGALEEGFRRAWTSIRDSNISTMITAAVLYTFTSSFVQGFALTLFIGVVMSMFSAITITRTLLRVLLQDKTVQKTNL